MSIFVTVVVAFGTSVVATVLTNRVLPRMRGQQDQGYVATGPIGVPRQRGESVMAADPEPKPKSSTAEKAETAVPADLRGTSRDWSGDEAEAEFAFERPVPGKPCVLEVAYVQGAASGWIKAKLIESSDRRVRERGEASAFSINGSTRTVTMVPPEVNRLRMDMLNGRKWTVRAPALEDLPRTGGVLEGEGDTAIMHAAGPIPAVLRVVTDQSSSISFYLPCGCHGKCTDTDLHKDSSWVHENEIAYFRGDLRQELTLPKKPGVIVISTPGSWSLEAL